MGDLRHSFDPVFFSEEEKTQLAVRLKAAAEQGDNMRDSTKRTIRHISHRIIIGGIAAALLTVSAAAAVISGGLLDYFDPATPEAKQVLNESVYQIGRSESYHGWTVALTDCVGDDTEVYLWVEVAAPDGNVLAPKEDGEISADWTIQLPEGMSGITGGNARPIEDTDPTDNRIAFCLDIPTYMDTLRGASIDLTLEQIAYVWWSDPGTEQAEQNIVPLSPELQDYKWVFEDVRLDFPVQTISLTPNTEVDYLNGTALLTKVEISPLHTRVRLEGGSCKNHTDYLRELYPPKPASSEETVTVGGITITTTDGEAEEAYWSGETSCWGQIETTLFMKDGSVIEAPKSGTGSNCDDGDDPYREVTAYVEKFFGYSEDGSMIAPKIIDPAQVDYILVNGVRVELPEAET